jgi:hypothetical protein
MNKTTKRKNTIFAALMTTSLAITISILGSVSAYAQGTNNISATSATGTNITLGEPFYMENGKITGPYTYSANGTIMSNNNASAINVTNSGVILTIPIDNNGTLYSQGQGVLTTEDGEMATYTFQFIGELTEGGTPPHGSWYLSTNSTGSLGFLNNKVGITQSEIGPNGEFSTRVWEWN